MDKVIIRKAKIEDSAQVAALTSQMGVHTYSEVDIKPRLEHFLQHDNEVVFVAEKDGILHGCVSIYANWELLTGIQARIDIIVVDSNSRGLGVGKLLMRKAEEWAKEQGSSSMKLVSNAKRLDSHKFYEKIGYTKAKEQFQFKINFEEE